MKNKIFSALLTVSITISLMCMQVSANSSWRWVSETRPYEILPFIIMITLFIETSAYIFIAKIKRPIKTFIFVAIANLISFLAPYISGYLGYTGGFTYTFQQALDYTPYYTIGLDYYLTTIFVEFPIIWFSLLKDVNDKYIIKFFFTIVCTNLITTLICAFAERMIAYGVW